MENNTNTTAMGQNATNEEVASTIKIEMVGPKTQTADSQTPAETATNEVATPSTEEKPVNNIASQIFKNAMQKGATILQAQNNVANAQNPVFPAMPVPSPVGEVQFEMPVDKAELLKQQMQQYVASHPTQHAHTSQPQTHQSHAPQPLNLATAFNGIVKGTLQVVPQKDPTHIVLKKIAGVPNPAVTPTMMPTSPLHSQPLSNQVQEQQPVVSDKTVKELVEDKQKIMGDLLKKSILAAKNKENASEENPAEVPVSTETVTSEQDATPVTPILPDTAGTNPTELVPIPEE